MVFASSSVFYDFLSRGLEVLLKELALFFGLCIFLNIGRGCEYSEWDIFPISFSGSTLMIYMKATIDAVFNIDFVSHNFFFDSSTEAAKEMIYCIQVTLGHK